MSVRYRVVDVAPSRRNPTLMRLEELEHAERIAEKIGNLSVIGGIDALLPRIREALTTKEG